MPARNAQGGVMLGDVIELSVVVRDLDAAVERYTKLFGLKVHHRSEAKDVAFNTALPPTGIGHIELMQPTDPTKAVGKFLAKNGEGVYLVGFESKDVPAATAQIKAQGARVSGKNAIAWVHPADAHGVFVELRHRESYS